MSRRLYAAPLVALLLGAVLLVLAALPAPVAPRALALSVGAPQDSRSSRFWPVEVRLGRAPSAVDVVLSLRLVDGRLRGRHVAVDVCRSGACQASETVWSTAASLDRTLPVGRVGSVEPRQALHLGVRVSGGSGARPRLVANASPCTAPRADELWRVRRTALDDRPNTLAGLENCSSRRPPFLPFALEVLGAGAAIALASRRLGP